MILRLVLGALFAAMAAGQLASFGAMPDIISAYGLTSGSASTTLVILLIAAEAVVAAWFLARPRSRALAPVWIYTGVFLLWTLLTLQAFVRGLDLDNCGCFGNYLRQPLRWWVLIEDALLLLYAWLLLHGSTRGQATNARRARHTTHAATPHRRKDAP
ncbi:MauE/DoxX family redox-associated membrane protein [Streptomyces apocyni]|uniref:MauE/DoxX family redox-associated membrane protein n=1 Tax=Streptomyces apocyni TaxID=2654677 RepID=UPI0012E9D7B3|nr:MauE/DoxX family redox-associated membrane protein [Streptomyces apocyni]